MRTHKQRATLTSKISEKLSNLSQKTFIQMEKKRGHGFAFCQSLNLLDSLGIIEGIFTNPAEPPGVWPFLQKEQKRGHGFIFYQN